MTPLFTKLDASMIEQVLQVLQFGTSDRLYEIQSDSISALTLMNEFVFEHLKMPQVPVGNKNYTILTNINSFATSPKG